MGEGRFLSFTTGYKDTDLWIGIDPDSYREEMKTFCFDRIKFYRTQLENYLAIDPEFGRSLKPYQTNHYAPELAIGMALAAKKANVGPMAAVAGAFAQQLGNDLMNQYKIKEIAIENVRKTCIEILLEQEPIFYQYRQMLTPIQWNILNGIAREHKVYQPNSKVFLQKYKLGTPANMKRAIDSLTRNEMLLNDRDEKGNFYRVYNVFLLRWLEYKS